MPLAKIQLKPGVVKDVTAYSAEGGWVDTDKVRFRAGFPEKIGGWKRYTTNQFTGTARSLHQWTNLLGDRYIAVGTRTKLYVDYSGMLYDITPIGYTPGVDSQVLGGGWGVGAWGIGPWGIGASSFDATKVLTIWSMDNYGEDLIAAPAYQSLYIWKSPLGTSSPATLISAESGANKVPLVAGDLFVTDDRHVVVLETNDEFTTTLDRMLVRWSAQEDFTDWENRTDNTAGSQRLGVGSYLAGRCKGRNESLIWTDKAVYSMQFIGPPFTFGFYLISDGLSIVSKKAAVNARNSIYWMDFNNFFLYNGSVLPLKCPVLTHVFGDFNMDQRQKVHGGLNSQFNEIWWYYPSANSSECDRYVMYNFLTEDWAVGTMTRSAWCDQALNGYPVAASTDGYLYQHEIGYDDHLNPMQAYAESGDFDIGDGEQFYFVPRMLPDVKLSGTGASAGVRMILKQRNSTGESLVTRADCTVVPTTEYKNVRMRGRQAVMRIESDGLGIGWRLGSPRLDIQPDGRK